MLGVIHRLPWRGTYLSTGTTLSLSLLFINVRSVDELHCNIMFYTFGQIICTLRVIKVTIT
jgi:hypothetical protein